jgi:hypothetical protein
MTTGFYPPMPRSPVTELSAGIDAIDTDIPVVNAARLPAGPNVATIGGGEDDSETVKYTGKTGNTLTGCTRGFDPAGSAKAWDSGTAVARVITSQDIEVLQDHAQAETGAEHGAVSAATANMIIRRDASSRARVAAPSHDDDIANKKYVDDEIGGVGGLALGETSATAYRGDRGKIAYDHSLLVSATNDPHGLGSTTLKAGKEAVASGTQAVALGQEAQATATRATAVGCQAVADANYSAALGDGADAGGDSAVALGRLADAGGTYSVALGRAATAAGDRGVAVGWSASAAGTSSTAVGRIASASHTNATAIGHGASATADNTIRVGNSSVTSIGGQVGWTTISDKRDKKDIEACEHGLDFINKVKPVKFKMDPRDRYEDKKSDGSKADKDYSYGFIAQELLEVQKGTDLHIVNETDPNNLGVTAESLIPILVKAVQELSKEVEELKRQVK